MTSLAELVIAASEDAWRRLGLPVSDHAVVAGGVRLRFVDGAGGVVAWGLDGLPDPGCTDIDGLPTHAAAVPAPVTDPLGIVAFDHVVVMTSSLERTCGAIEAATGAPLKRVREAGAIRQGFHRLGPVIVEVVENPQVSADRASFWGFVWTVADLPAVCAQLGPEIIAPPKAAVQPGRSIATVRASLGLGVPLALMSPGPR